MFHRRSAALSAAVLLPLVLAAGSSSAQMQNVPSIVRQCHFGQPLTGLSAFTSGQQQAHEVLCSGWVTTQNINQLELFDSSLPASSWDWDPQYFKADCPNGYYVQATSKSLGGAPHAILCCPP